MPVDTRTIGQYENRAILLPDDLFLLQSSDGEYFNATTQQIANEVPGLVGIQLSDIIIDVDKDWETKRITNVGDPVDSQDVATKFYVDDNAGEFFGPWTGDHDAGVNNLVNLSNLEFSETSGKPASTSVSIYREFENLVLNVNEFTEIKFTFKDSLKYAFSESGANFNTIPLQNAPHNHQNILGGNQLTATLALNATGTKDSTTFLRGDNTWAVPIDVEIFTWTDDHSAATKNLTNLGELQFDANTTISRSGAIMEFDVVSGEYLFIINTQTRFSVSNTKVNIHGTILDLSGATIQFDSNLVRISQEVNGALRFDVDEDDSFIFNIFNGTEYTLSKAFFNVHNKKIINVVDPTNAQDVATKNYSDTTFLIGSNTEWAFTNDTLTIADGNDIVVGTTTGTKFGTSPTSKIGFWGKTPVTQQLHISNPLGGVNIDVEARAVINFILANLAVTGLHASS